VVADMRSRVDASVQLPEGYRLEWSGEFENQQRAMKRLGWVIPLSVLIIFVLLFDAFKDISSAALILANVPLAMIGGILALWLTGIPLSVSAAIGFIALFGQAVLNGVVMLSRFAQLREQGMDLLQSVVQGSLQRLRTVLMTALLATFGLLPMATSHAIGAETQKPLAVVVIGGLLSAMLLTAGGNLFGRLVGRPGAIIRLPGIIMMVPGSTSLRGVLTLVQQQDVGAGQSVFLTVLNVVMALVAGLLFGNLLMPARKTL